MSTLSAPTEVSLLFVLGLLLLAVKGTNKQTCKHPLNHKHANNMQTIQAGNQTGAIKLPKGKIKLIQMQTT